jgi:hypothetical protein
MSYSKVGHVLYYVYKNISCAKLHHINIRLRLSFSVRSEIKRNRREVARSRQIFKERLLFRKNFPSKVFRLAVQQILLAVRTTYSAGCTSIQCTYSHTCSRARQCSLSSVSSLTCSLHRHFR